MRPRVKWVSSNDVDDFYMFDVLLDDAVHFLKQIQRSMSDTI